MLPTFSTTDIFQNPRGCMRPQTALKPADMALLHASTCSNLVPFPPWELAVYQRWNLVVWDTIAKLAIKKKIFLTVSYRQGFHSSPDSAASPSTFPWWVVNADIFISRNHSTSYWHMQIPTSLLLCFGALLNQNNGYRNRAPQIWKLRWSLNDGWTGDIHSVDMLDEWIHIRGEMEASMQFKTLSCLVLEFFHLIFSSCGWLLATEMAERETIIVTKYNLPDW